MSDGTKIEFYKFGPQPKYLVHRLYVTTGKTFCGQGIDHESAPMGPRERYCHPCKLRLREQFPDTVRQLEMVTA